MSPWNECNLSILLASWSHLDEDDISVASSVRLPSLILVNVLLSHSHQDQRPSTSIRSGSFGENELHAWVSQCWFPLNQNISLMNPTQCEDSVIMFVWVWGTSCHGGLGEMRHFPFLCQHFLRRKEQKEASFPPHNHYLWLHDSKHDIFECVNFKVAFTLFAHSSVGCVEVWLKNQYACRNVHVCSELFVSV